MLPDNLRILARQVENEDLAADRLLTSLLKTPAALALRDLSAEPTYRTAGVARRLLSSAHDNCERQPLNALTIADSAAAVASALDDKRYPRGVIGSLRASAAKERANALRALGRYDEALSALNEAERIFDESVSAAPLARASLTYIRAAISVEREEYAVALPLVRECARAFRKNGDIDRYMRARHLEGHIRYYQRDIREARRIYEEVLAFGLHENNLLWVARSSRTLGHCSLDLGDVSSARRHMEAAAAAFAQLGLTVEVTRTDWGLGLVLAGEQRSEEAVNVLELVRGRLTGAGLLTDAALVTLDMMDSLHALGRNHEIASEAAAIIKVFTNAGMLTSAMTAFAYLRDSRAVTRREIEHVRRFLYRLDREPLLPFAPPVED